MLARLVGCASQLSWLTSSRHACSFSAVRGVEVTSDAPSPPSFRDLNCSTRLRRPCKEGAGCRHPRILFCLRPSAAGLRLPSSNRAPGDRRCRAVRRSDQRNRQASATTPISSPARPQIPSFFFSFQPIGCVLQSQAKVIYLLQNGTNLGRLPTRAASGPSAQRAEAGAWPLGVSADRPNAVRLPCFVHRLIDGPTPPARTRGRTWLKNALCR